MLQPRVSRASRVLRVSIKGIKGIKGITLMQGKSTNKIKTERTTSGHIKGIKGIIKTELFSKTGVYAGSKGGLIAPRL